MIYRFTDKAASERGGHIEAGSFFCSDCFGTWPPESPFHAISHVLRGTCGSRPERLARFVPLRPERAFIFPEYGAPERGRYR